MASVYTLQLLSRLNEANMNFEDHDNFGRTPMPSELTPLRKQCNEAYTRRN